MYQNIARANFSAERGMRYGQDYYDDRMQASRRLSIASTDQGLHRFHVSTAGQVSEKGDKSSDADIRASETDKAVTGDDGTAPTDEGKQEEDVPKPATVKADKQNPLRWFGLLAPMPLRQAQALSVQAVDEVIPKLVTISTEMAHIEIEVRRARKKRAKAEAAVGKDHHENVASKGIAA